MRDAENGKTKEPENTHPADPVISGSGGRERPRLFESGPQPLRPTTPLHTIPQPQKPIPRPEPRPRFSRTLRAFKTALPLLQKALPLLEGNVASAVANLLTPLPQNTQTDLEPVNHALATLYSEQQTLHGKVAEQSTSLQQMSEQLNTLEDTASRQTATQQELTDDLSSLRRRVTVIAVAGLVLLAASVALNAFLLLHIGYVLH